MTKKQWIAYLIIGIASLVSYFAVRDYLAYTYAYSKPFIVSNFTLNYLLIMLGWGAAAPYLFRRKPFLAKWALVLGGFVLILFILTLGGLHTRLTDWFGAKGD